MTLRVLHFTESYGAGVGTAVEQYMKCIGMKHSLVARVRPEFIIPGSAKEVPRVLVNSNPELVRQWLLHRKQRFDVVHLHSTVAGVIARALPHPSASVVYSPHALALNHNNRTVRFLASNLEHNLAARTDAFAAVSNAEADELARLRRGRTPIYVIPHAIDTSTKTIERRKRARRVVAVGRLSFQKNPEAIAELPDLLGEQGIVGIAFEWIGDGEPERRRMLEAHGWHVTGWIPRTEARAIIGNSLLTVHAARYEGLPLSVLEAMAVGTPVVASDLPAFRELAGVVRHYSVRDMAAGVVQMLTDSDYWTYIGQAGRDQVARQFTRTRQDAALARIYTDVAASNSRSGH